MALRVLFLFFSFFFLQSLPTVRLEPPILLNESIRRDLHLEFSDWRASVLDTVEWFLEEGFLVDHTSQQDQPKGAPVEGSSNSSSSA